ncbi:MAG: hypothetical protein HY901_36900, partial [Deltaproteobacteria bacterium]|nr:hypothetical protein [Deltaproteobacteria bacterium]
CAAGEVCNTANQCCTPRCEGRTCGDDGCGGECGPGCNPGQLCSNGTCLLPADAGTSAGPDAGPSIPHKVLIFHGHGGVGPEGMWGDMKHADTLAVCAQEGLTASHATTWPGSLTDFRLVILPAPGFNEAAARFSAGEVAQIKAFLEAGGILAIEAEKAVVLDHACIEALLADLGSPARFESGWVDGKATRITTHALTSGVTRIGLAAAGQMVLNGEQCIAATEEACVVAARGLGQGWLVLVADGNTFSNMATWDTAQDSNRRLLRNLLRLP